MFVTLFLRETVIVHVNAKMKMKDLNSGFKIADLIVKRLEDRLTDEECQYLEEWKQANEENSILFQKLSMNPEKQYLERESKLEKSNKKANWDKIQAKIKKGKVRKLNMNFLKIAAVLILTIGSTLFFSNLLDNNVSSVINPGKQQAILITSDGERYQLDEEVIIKEGDVFISNKTQELIYQKKSNITKSQLTYNTIIIPKGGEYKLTLMDGTRIWLNSNSKLRFPSEFGSGIRKVELKGEAFFEVAKDSVHPFVVNANKAQVKVLGTSFNVNAYLDLNEIVTTLVEGKVEVSDTLFGNKVKLLPNEQYRFNKSNGKTLKQVVDTEIYTAWKDGRFVFENESLEDIMIRLSRWYNVEVSFLNESVKELRFSGDLTRYDNIDQILELIEVTQKVKFTIKDRALWVEEV
ncbi:FecR family protein [Marinifilum flexuosum]|uniref:FecR family protein n=2 Tax=Marinifilum flexuosum TaxID=1117708 RepID=A0A419WXQ9_9BACT|nr:FecR family protein [Marinifilum flexuosum]